MFSALPQTGVGTNWAIYTDGLTAARDDADVFNGMERFAKLVCDAGVCGRRISRQNVLRWSARLSPARLAGDVTVVLICREF